MDLIIVSEWRMLPTFVTAVATKCEELFPEVTDLVHLDPVDDADELRNASCALQLGASKWTPAPGQKVYHAPSVKEVLGTPGGLTKLAYAINLYVNGSDWAEDFEADYTRITATSFDYSTPRDGLALTVDIEVSGDISKDEPEDCELLAVSVLWEDPEEHIIVFDQEALQNPSKVGVLKDILTRAAELDGHNGKFDFRWLCKILGVFITPTDDTMLMHHSMFPGAGEHGLKQLAQRILGAPEWEAGIEQYIGRGKGHFERIPQGLLCQYNAQDVHWTRQLKKRFMAMLAVRPNERRAYELEMEAARMFQEVEALGMPVDREYGGQLDEFFISEKEAAQEALELATRSGFNANSPKQVKGWFDDLGIAVPDTSKETLAALRMKGIEIEMIDALIKVRRLTKAHSTYVTSILNRLREDATVHPVFKIHGTTTGRLSCGNPNVQNVPNDDETDDNAPSLRRMYREREGWVFVGADYAQAELRTIAEMADDEQMIFDLRDGAPDFFDNMLPSVWPDINWDDPLWTPKSVRKPYRLKEKRIVYGLNYGRTAWAIANALTLEGSPTTEEEAQFIADGYLNRYPGLKAWRAGAMDKVYAGEWISPFGRVFQQDVVVGARRSVQNAAWAHLPQGTASDICLSAAINLHKTFKKNEWEGGVCATVHDAIYSRCPVEISEEVLAATQAAMENAAARVYNRVPFPVDGHIAREWNKA